MPDSKKIDIAWEPAPGYVLCRPVKREELQKSSGLELPDSAGKVSDAVGVGEVIECGDPTYADLIEADKAAELTINVKSIWSRISPGDLIAFMPYTDKLLEIDLKKYSVVAYKQIMAVRKKK